MNIDFELIDYLKNKVLEIYEKSKEIGDLNIKNKEGNDIVTEIDLFMEKEISKVIKELFPDHSIHGEEFGESVASSEYEWLLDPIDGTINFANGIPLFSTNIALNKNDETILGLIVIYNENNCYYALKGKGAFCNGEPIHVSQKEELKDSVITFCLTSHYNTERINEVLDIEKMLADKVRGLRLIVSSCIELAWLASGKIDGYINIKASKGIGSAAGRLLVEEAGGIVTNIKGKKRAKIDTNLISNGIIHKKLLNALKYVVFFGNITEVIEINPENDIKVYMAGKAYSQASAASAKGVNVKLITVISGLRKKEKDALLKDMQNQNIDVSHIKISNDIDNDLKIIIVGEEGEKNRVENISKGSASAVDEGLVEDNIEIIKNASFVVCQTKINNNVTKKLTSVAKENSIPVITLLNRTEDHSFDENAEIVEIIDDSKYAFCTSEDLRRLFPDEDIDTILERYQNKLIVLSGDDGVKYHNGENIVNIQSEDNSELNKVGTIDRFIGCFVYEIVNDVKLQDAIELLIKRNN